MNNDLRINAYLQMIEEYSSRAQDSIIRCQKSLIKIKENSEDSDMSKALNTDLTNEKILELIKKGKVSKKIEKIFWFRFFQFSYEEVNLIRNNIGLSQEKIFRVLLKVWNLKIASDNLRSLSFLDEVLNPPSFLSKWTDLGDLQKISEIASSVGAPLLSNSYSLEIPFKKGSNFSLYLISIYFLNNIESSSLESLVNELELDPALKNLFPNKMDERSGVSVVNFIFIAALLRAVKGENKINFPNLYRNLLTVRDLPSFGDPRSTPLGLNWVQVQNIESEGFEDWKKSFNEEDIEFFFKELTSVNPERRKFWLKYKRTANKVIVVLDRPKKENLLNSFIDDEKALDIVKRSYRYNSDAKKEQYLIILFFNEVVVIEGSNTGFGCQIFLASKFDQSFGKSFNEKKAHVLIENSFERFRGMGSGRKDTWTHFQGWEDDFKIKLQREYSIYQDRTIESNLKPQANINKQQTDTSTIKSVEFARDDGFSRINEIIRLVQVNKINDIPKQSVVVESNLESKALDSINSVISVLEKIKIIAAKWDCDFIDKTSLKGHLWVLCSANTEPFLLELKKVGIKLHYSPNGSKATEYKEAWYFSLDFFKKNLTTKNSNISVRSMAENFQANSANLIVTDPSSNVEVSKLASTPENIIKILFGYNVPFIDETKTTGYLWVTSSSGTRASLAKLRSHGVNFSYTPNGSRVTGNKESWYIKFPI